MYIKKLNNLLVRKGWDTNAFARELQKMILVEITEDDGTISHNKEKINGYISVPFGIRFVNGVWRTRVLRGKLTPRLLQGTFTTEKEIRSALARYFLSKVYFPRKPRFRYKYNGRPCVSAWTRQQRKLKEAVSGTAEASNPV